MFKKSNVSANCQLPVRRSICVGGPIANCLPSYTFSILTVCVVAIVLGLQHPLYLDDSLRHLAMSRLLWNDGISNFPGWDTFFFTGALAHSAFDPWFLYHIILIPIGFLPNNLAIDFMSIGCFAAVFAAFWWLIRTVDISPKYQAVLLLLFTFGEVTFTNRLLLGRPFLLITALSLVILGAMLQRRMYIIALCLITSVLLSQLYIFPLFFLGCGCLLHLLRKEYTYSMQLMMVAVLSISFALILHPHTAEYLHYLWSTFSAILLSDTAQLGKEMHGSIGRFLPFTEAFFAFTVASLIIGLLWVAPIRSRSRSRDTKIQNSESILDLDLDLILTLSLSLTFLLLSLRWRRAIDFLWPLSLFLFAQIHAYAPSAYNDVMRCFSDRANKKYIFVGIAVICLSVLWHFRSIDFLWSILILFIGVSLQKSHIAIKFICICVVTFNIAQLLLWSFPLDSGRSLDLYSGIRHVPSDSRVFNLDWDAFPPFVLHNPNVQYAQGIDQTFLRRTHPDVADILTKITTLEEDSTSNSYEAAALIYGAMQRIDADHVTLISVRYPRLVAALKNVKEFQLVSDEGMVSVFSLK